MLKTIIYLLVFTGFALSASAQRRKNKEVLKDTIPARADSIAFHLYTDSLKRNVHNYINVDGMTEGKWLPLTAKDLTFSSSAGRFEGTSLILDSGFKGPSVTVKAILKSNPAIWKEITIYLKTVETEEHLKSAEEVMKDYQKPRRRKG